MIRYICVPSLRTLFFVLCLLLSLCCTPAGLRAASGDKKPLIVSIAKNYSPFTVISPTGEPTGLFVEMWRLWSEQTGVPVKFLADDFLGSLDTIRNGRADVHSGLFVNERRGEWMAFSDPIHEIKTSLFFRADADAYSTLEDMAGKRIGAIEGFSQLRYLIDNHKQILPFSYPDGRKLILALLKGEVDAILNENVMVESDLAHFGIRGALKRGDKIAFSNAVVAAVRKDRKELLSVINEGFRNLSIERMARLEERWLPDPVDRYYERRLLAKEFTPEEEAWIRNHPAVTVAATNFLPLLDTAGEDGAYKGLNPDLLSLLSERTGLEFVPVFHSTWNKTLTSVMSGEADIGLNMSRTPEREKELLFTDPYAFVPLLAVVKRDDDDVTKWADLGGKRIAILEGGAIREELRKTIGDKGKLITAKNIAESMELVSRGEADALIAGLLRYHKAQRTSPVKGLKIAARYVGEGGTFRIGIHRSKPLLAKILEKGLKRISHQELVDMRDRWLTIKETQGPDLTSEERDWIKQRKSPVIVGAEMDWPPFDFVKDGKPTGYSNELIRLAAQKVNLPLTFASGFTWAELVEKFKKGDIDVLPAVYKTPVREREMAFTQFYAGNPSVLVGHEKKQNIRSFEELAGKKLAVVEGFSINKLIEQKHPKIEQIPFNNVLEALKAVSLEKADGFVGSLGVISHILKENMLPGIRVVDEVSLEDPDATYLHVATLKEQAVLRDIIQKGLDAITEEELNELRVTWLGLGLIQEHSSRLQLELTREERAWIKANPVIKVAATPNWPPFEFEEKDEYKGLHADVIRLAAEKAGLRVEPVFGKWSDLMDKLKNKRLDLCPGLNATEERKKYLIFSDDTVSETSVVIIAPKEAPIGSIKELDGRTVSVEKGYATESFLKENFPHIRLLSVDSTLEALKAVITGKVDAYCGNQAVALYLIKKNSFSGLGITAFFDEAKRADYRIGVVDNKPLLRNILQKGLAAVKSGEMTALQEKWFGLSLGRQTGKPDLTLTDEEKAWIKANPVVKVAATPDFPPFEYQDSDGNYRGIAADALRLIAKRVGLKTEIVLKPWNENAPRLKSGELDLCPGLRKTPERSKYLMFTSPYISSQDAIWVNKDRDDITSVTDFSGETIAVEENYHQQGYLERNHPDARLLLVNSPLEALKAVSTGKADAYMGTLAVGTYLIEQHMLTDLKIVGYFDKHQMELAMGVHAGKPVLRDILQKGQDAISEKELNEIKQKYLAPDAPKSFYLTDPERQWLEAHKNIRLGVDPSWFPFEGFGSDGRYMGIVSEYVNWLNKKLGLSMRPTGGLNWQEVITEAKTGGIDVLPGVGVTPARQEYLDFTRSYLRIPIVLVTREDMPFVSGLEGLAGKRVAIIANAPMGQKLKAEHPELRYLETKNLVEALRAVADGDADATLGNNASLTYYVRRDDIQGLKVVTTLPQTLDLALGVRKDWPQFVTILDKALAAIPDAEHRSFQDRWVNIQVQSRMDWKPVVGISLSILLVAGTILVVILHANRKLAGEIHERKAAETKVRAMSEASHDAMIMINARGEVMFWNTAAEAMFGYRADEVQGRLMHELFVPPAFHDKAAKGLERFAATGQGPVIGNVIEHEALDRSGEPFPVEIAVSSFQQNDGWYAVGSVRDITERKAADQALQENEAKYRELVENANSIIIKIDWQGRITFFNEFAQTFFGYTADDILGKNAVGTIIPETESTGRDMEEMFRNIVDHPERYEHNENENIRKNGERVWVSWTNRAIFDEEGQKATELMSIGRDITERKQMEDALEERVDELARARLAMLNIMEDLELARKTTEDALNVITGSINYATNIQGAILPAREGLEALFADYFVLWEPRDRVGGDIYFMKPWGIGKMFALGDCTGHGVPGAFMTMIANGALEMAVLESQTGNSAGLMQRTHQIIQETLNQKDDGGTSDDGLEMGICYIAPGNEPMIFTGARFSLFYVEDGEVFEIKGDKKGLGYRGVAYNQTFTNHRVALRPKRTFYMTSDGLIDQVGGKKRRSFGKKRFKRLLLEMESMPMDRRADHIRQALTAYQGREKRRDDVSVVGFTFGG